VTERITPCAEIFTIAFFCLKPYCSSTPFPRPHIRCSHEWPRVEVGCADILEAGNPPARPGGKIDDFAGIRAGAAHLCAEGSRYENGISL
jgi:hypothetical protein